MENSESRLLIVDDNPRNLQVLGKTLEREKYKVEFSLDGESALSWIKNQKFDLILLDIVMPGISGLEVCKTIRSDHENDDIPIIFLSADTDKETILEGFELGAQDYVTKPFDSRELLARVRTHLELKTSKEHLKKVNFWLEEQVRKRTVDLERVNRELEYANMELLGLDKLKNEFLNIIGHEVRTALNGIMGSIQLLKIQIEGEKLSNLVKILDLSVSRLERFSLTALTVTELKTGTRKIRKEEIILVKLLQDVSKKITDLTAIKSIRLNATGVPHDTVITGDPDLLTICLESIIGNAVKYSPEGGEVRISAGKRDNKAYCEITDQGKGFSESALKYLFRLFIPGEPHIDQNIGLDFPLANLIMEVHSGKIEVENIAEGGALVRLIFSEASTAGKN